MRLMGPMRLMRPMGRKGPILFSDELSVALGPAIAEELPGVTDLANHVQIQISDHQRVLVSRSLGDNLPARIAKVTLAIEFADVPRQLMADAINRPDKISVGDRMRGLFQLPEIFRETRDGC